MNAKQNTGRSQTLRRPQILSDNRRVERGTLFGRSALVFAGLMLALGSSLHAQGVLTISPARSVVTAAGTGTVGLSGATPATATFAGPGAVAYDSNGNLFVADSLNNVVRMITPGGTVSIVAGTGVEGYSGDGSAATSAQLDTPKGIAVDSTGNIYIADSRNNRIRKVTGTTITTIAGTGIAGNALTQMALPSGIAVDSSGNVYVADTNNNRVLKLTGGTATLLAGTGQEGYAGDGGAATSAQLDLPTGVAVDSTGNVYIADRHNQAIRKVTGTTITTIAGSGVSFAGSFSGDGATATGAGLSKPTGVAVDAAGNIYITDTNNQRIRQISNGVIATVAGNGLQGYSADGAAATAAQFNAPQGSAIDAAGNVVVADTLNERIRSTAFGSLTFGATALGFTSASQAVTLGNAGASSLTVSTLSYTGPFATTSGGSCSATPITIGVGGSCTVNVAFTPQAVGAASGSFNAVSGTLQQKVLLKAAGAQGTVTVALVTSNASVPAGAPVTFTASVSAVGTGGPIPSGSVTFKDGSTTLLTVNLVSGTAAYTTSSLSVATHSITATYNGDVNYITAVSSAISEVVSASVPPYIWIANGNSTVSRLSSSGVPYSSPSGYATGGFGIAIDNSGNAWSGNSGSVTMFTSTGTTGVTYSGGGIGTPASIAIAGDGAVWIANTNGTLSTLANTGTALSPATGYNGGGLSTPSGLAIDGSGNVWVTNAGDSSLTEFVGAAEPVVTPLATAVKNTTQGVKP